MKGLIKFTLLLSFAFWSCNNPKESKKGMPTSTVDTSTIKQSKDDGLTQQDSIKASGRQVLGFLKANNYIELSKYFSNNGVRFSPYGFIDTANSQKIIPEDFLNAINKKWVLTWGSFDGTGDPIKLPIPAYLKKFVYNADYLNAEVVGFDVVMKQGNSLNNLKDLYPKRHFIDYYFSGFDQKNEGMDWTSLRLVFEKEDGQYFLVAIIHDQRTV